MDPLASMNTFVSNPTVNTLILAILIYFLRDFATTVKKLEKTVDDLRLEVAGEYATREELEERMNLHERMLHNHSTSGRK